MVPLAELLEFLERRVPLRLAAEWDNVGLLLGDRQAAIQRVMTCLTVTPASAREAVEREANLIVTHHPVLFRGVKRLTADEPEGRMLLSLLNNRIAVYSPHTAFDNAEGGINDRLSTHMGLTDVEPLRSIQSTRRFKVVVFTPDGDLAKVSDALFAAGAGNIGQYSQCSFRTAGTGTFFGSDASNPTLGSKGRREEAAEWRLEVVCDEPDLLKMTKAIRQAHSYEEPAFDVHALEPIPGQMGEGRIGSLSHPSRLDELAGAIRATLACGPVQIVGDPGRRVERLAVVCGAGGEFLCAAVHARADVLVTGEMGFHSYLEAEAANLALILPGHYATERLGVLALAEWLSKEWPGLQVWASTQEQDPVHWA